MSDPSIPLVHVGAMVVTVDAGELDGVKGPYRLAVDPGYARTLLRLIRDSVDGFGCRLEEAIVAGEERPFADIVIDGSAVAGLIAQLEPIAAME